MYVILLSLLAVGSVAPRSYVVIPVFQQRELNSWEHLPKVSATPGDEYKVDIGDDFDEKDIEVRARGNRYVILALENYYRYILLWEGTIRTNITAGVTWRYSDGTVTFTFPRAPAEDNAALQ